MDIVYEGSGSTGVLLWTATTLELPGADVSTATDVFEYRTLDETAFAVEDSSTGQIVV